MKRSHLTGKKSLHLGPKNPKSFEIELDVFDQYGLEPIYRAGQVVKGSITFSLSEPFNFRSE